MEHKYKIGDLVTFREGSAFYGMTGKIRRSTNVPGSPHRWLVDVGGEAAQVRETSLAGVCEPDTPRPASDDPRLFGGAEMMVSETGGEKGVKLARFDLMPMDALYALAEHYGLGEKKYPTKEGLPNFRRGFGYSASIGAAFRHLTAFSGGEDLDPDPAFGDSHLLAVAWHALTLWQCQHDFGDRFDDRPAVALRKLLDPEPRSEN